MSAYDKTTFDYRGFAVTIHHHQDDNMGPPWKEHDGHGPVSDWTRRDKQPGERTLTSDRGSRRFYDFAEAIRIAKRDGWGLTEKHKAELAAKLGRQPTAGEITAAAVECDFQYLKDWCDNRWFWKGYTTTITGPDGEQLDGDSCWGFDDEKYMVSEASDCARFRIDRHLAKAAKESAERTFWEERDVETVGA